MLPAREPDGWFTVDDRFLDFAAGLRPWRPVNEEEGEREGWAGRAFPQARPLRVYTRDAAASRLAGGEAVARVPFEPLEPGPRGRLVEVLDLDASLDRLHPPVDLDARAALLGQGRAPSLGDFGFHQQMAYTVVMRTWKLFREALGRDPAWGFRPQPDGRLRLRVRPHAARENNAFYDPEAGELRFGYYDAAGTVRGRNRQGGRVYTCLSHDIVAHETAHALLDGMRPRFFVPSNPDVMAFHEAFADLVAIFQHFAYPEVVRAALERSPEALVADDMLVELAAQFGHTTASNGPLRTAIEAPGRDGRPAEPLRLYDPGLEAHGLGSVLVSAVFEAFSTIFAQRTRRLRELIDRCRLARGGPLDPDLAAMLAEMACKVARQLLRMCVRAIDYCPPVDITFGDFLRALVTADADLVPEDPWGYREALMDAFAKRRVYAMDVPNLAEDVLVWRPPCVGLQIPELHFKEIRFEGDPGRAPAREELERQARAVGRCVTRPENAAEFGLALPGDPGLEGDAVDPPRITSVRTLRRAGPDQDVSFGLVAEVVQVRRLRSPGGGPAEFHGGATLIVGPEGEVRYAVTKRVTNGERARAQRDYALGAGRPFWRQARGGLAPLASPLLGLHRGTEAAAC